MSAWVGKEYKSLRVTDYFERRWNRLTRGPLWAVRNRRKVAIPATVTSLVALRGALVRIYGFHGYEADQYEWSTTVEGCAFDACRADLERAGSPELARALRAYWLLAHVVVIGGLSFDFARLLGVETSFQDFVLGFHGASGERRRKARLLVFAAPLVHLVYLFWKPVAHGCCVATPKFDALKERAQELAFLSIVSAFVLLSNSQHHGYFFLRVPPLDNFALFLVRDHLVRCDDKRKGGKAKLHRASQFLMALGQGGGGAEKPHHSDSETDDSGSDSDDAAPSSPVARHVPSSPPPSSSSPSLRARRPPPPPPSPPPGGGGSPPARKSPKARLHEQHPPAY